MKRHLDNLEGAFPLLLIGSVLVVYAGILASQEVGSRGHLPLWGLFAGVGAVIVGAGIYSTFLEPQVAEAPSTEGDMVTVPRAEWEELRRREVSPEREPPAGRPIWWEGPPSPATVRAPSRAPPVRGGSAPPRPDASGVPVPGPAPTKPLPHPSPRPTRTYSLEELRATLDNLEALANSAPPPRPRSAWRRRADESLYCADCDSRLSDGSGQSRCVGCHRGLCERCAALSRSEDGEIRCNECRAVAS